MNNGKPENAVLKVVAAGGCQVPGKTETFLKVEVIEAEYNNQ